MAGFRRTSVGAARRVDFRGRGGGRTTVQVIDNSTSGNFYDLAGGGPAGSSSFSFAVIWRYTGVFGSGDMLAAGRYGTGGWKTQLNAGSGDRQANYVRDGTPATVFELDAIGGGLSVNKVQRSMAVLDGGVLKHYLNGVVLDAVGSVVTGYTAPTTEDFQIAKSTGLSGHSCQIAGVIIGGAMSAAEVLSWDDQVTSGNQWDFPTTDLLYDVANAGSTWAPQIGAGTLTEQGSVTTINVPADWE